MSDHILRLAKLTLRLAGDVLSETDADARNLHAALSSLVRDLEAAPDDGASRRAADLLISHFGGQSLEDAVEKAVALRYMKREQGIIPPWEMLVPPAPARRTITREELGDAMRRISLNTGFSSYALALDIAAAWRLTVEDA